MSGYQKVASLQEDITFRAIFEELKDMIWISTLQGKLIDVNSAGVELLGFSSKDELFGLETITPLYQSVKNYLTWKRLMEERGFVKDFEATMVKKSGEIIATIQSSCAIRDKRGRIAGYASVIRDITKNVRNEVNVHKANVELIDSLVHMKKTTPKLIQQEKLASIGQLAAGIAHELNNPVGFISSNITSLRSYIDIIKGYIEQCEETLGCLPKDHNDTLNNKAAKIREYREKQKVAYILGDIDDLMSESKEGIQRITEIVANLRNFSRIDNTSTVEQYNINEALESTLIVAKNEIKYVAEVEKHFSKVPPVKCIGNEVNQVFLNIIVNAAQAIKSLKYKEKGCIAIKTYAHKNDVYCEISDDGPGIPKDIVSRVFDPFFTTKEVGQGTGLGLNISYDIIVNKHGGDLTVESETGKGTTFTVRLPIKSHILRRGINGDNG
jgi:PAS domain S-box-containing protein